MSAPASNTAGVRLIVDLGAIRRNYRILVDRAGPGTTGSAVVKADAYGLGADRVAPCLAAAGCDDFFVATLDEGLRERLSERLGVPVVSSYGMTEATSQITAQPFEGCSRPVSTFINVVLPDPFGPMKP